MEFPAAPEGGAKRPAGFKTDKPIPLRQPGTFDYPFDPTLTSENTHGPVADRVSDAPLGSIPSYPGHQMWRITLTSPSHLENRATESTKKHPPISKLSDLKRWSPIELSGVLHTT